MTEEQETRIMFDEVLAQLTHAHRPAARLYARLAAELGEDHVLCRKAEEVMAHLQEDMIAVAEQLGQAKADLPL